MNIKAISQFKDPKNDIPYFEKWVAQLESLHNRKYEKISLDTSLGKTFIYGWNIHDKILESLVIFPGARTTSLIWDFDKGLDNLGGKYRIFMVETNGLPNLSEGKTPDIKSLDYGHWANEVIEKIGLKTTFVAGASFGGLICMKLGITNPEKVKAAFILNPGCLQSFSMTFKNLYYNILPIIKPSPKNVLKFLDKAVFFKPNHSLSAEAEKMLVDYEVFAISRYKDNTQKPYFMGEQLSEVKADTYLLLGNQDLLFPWKKSEENATKLIKTLKDIKVFNHVGHGIETYSPALQYLCNTIEKYK